MLNEYGELRGVNASGMPVVELRIDEDEPTRLRSDGVVYAYKETPRPRPSWISRVLRAFGVRVG